MLNKDEVLPLERPWKEALFIYGKRLGILLAVTITILLGAFVYGVGGWLGLLALTSFSGLLSALHLFVPRVKKLEHDLASVQHQVTYAQIQVRDLRQELDQQKQETGTRLQLQLHNFELLAKSLSNVESTVSKLDRGLSELTTSEWEQKRSQRKYKLMEYDALTEEEQDKIYKRLVEDSKIDRRRVRNILLGTYDPLSIIPIERMLKRWGLDEEWGLTEEDLEIKKHTDTGPSDEPPK